MATGASFGPIFDLFVPNMLKTTLPGVREPGTLDLAATYLALEPTWYSSALKERALRPLSADSSILINFRQFSSILVQFPPFLSICDGRWPISA